MKKKFSILICDVYVCIYQHATESRYPVASSADVAPPELEHHPRKAVGLNGSAI